MPRLTQPFQRPRGICRTCGWKHRCFPSRDRKLVSFIKLSCLVSVCINTCYVRFSRIMPISVGCTFLILLSLEPLMSQLWITSHRAIRWASSMAFFSSIVSGTGSFKSVASTFQNGSVCARNKNCFLLIWRTAGFLIWEFRKLCRTPVQTNGQCVHIPWDSPFKVTTLSVSILLLILL